MNFEEFWVEDEYGVKRKSSLLEEEKLKQNQTAIEQIGQGIGKLGNYLSSQAEDESEDDFKRKLTPFHNLLIGEFNKSVNTHNEQIKKFFDKEQAQQRLKEGLEKRGLLTNQPSEIGFDQGQYQKEKSNYLLKNISPDVINYWSRQLGGDPKSLENRLRLSIQREGMKETPFGMTLGQQSFLRQSAEEEKEKNKPLYKRAAENLYNAYETNRKLIERGLIKMGEAPSPNILKNIEQYGKGMYDIGMGIAETGFTTFTAPMILSQPAASKIGEEFGNLVGSKGAGNFIGEMLPYFTMPHPLVFFAASKGSEYTTNKVSEILQDTNLSDEDKERILSLTGLGTFIFTHRKLRDIKKTEIAKYINKEWKKFGEVDIPQFLPKGTDAADWWIKRYSSPEAEANIKSLENGIKEINRRIAEKPKDAEQLMQVRDKLQAELDGMREKHVAIVDFQKLMDAKRQEGIEPSGYIEDKKPTTTEKEVKPPTGEAPEKVSFVTDKKLSDKPKVEAPEESVTKAIRYSIKGTNDEYLPFDEANRRRKELEISSVAFKVGDKVYTSDFQFEGKDAHFTLWSRLPDDIQDAMDKYWRMEVSASPEEVKKKFGYDVSDGFYSTKLGKYYTREDIQNYTGLQGESTNLRVAESMGGAEGFAAARRLAQYHAKGGQTLEKTGIKAPSPIRFSLKGKGKAKEAPGKTTVFHYGEGRGIKRTNPKLIGKSLKESIIPSKKPRTYFYFDKNDVEAKISGRTIYKGEVPTKRLYNINVEPKELKSKYNVDLPLDRMKLVKNEGALLNPKKYTRLLNEISKRGFSGIVYKVPDSDNIYANYFKGVNVKEVPKEKTLANISGAVHEAERGEGMYALSMEVVNSINEGKYEEAQSAINRVNAYAKRIVDKHLGDLPYHIRSSAEPSVGYYFGTPEASFEIEADVTQDQIPNYIDRLSAASKEMKQKELHVSQVFDKLPEGIELNNQQPDGSYYVQSYDIPLKQGLSLEQTKELYELAKEVELAGATIRNDKITLYGYPGEYYDTELPSRIRQLDKRLRESGSTIRENVGREPKEYFRKLYKIGEEGVAAPGLKYEEAGSTIRGKKPEEQKRFSLGLKDNEPITEKDFDEKFAPVIEDINWGTDAQKFAVAAEYVSDPSEGLWTREDIIAARYQPSQFEKYKLKEGDYGYDPTRELYSIGIAEKTTHNTQGAKIEVFPRASSDDVLEGILHSALYQIQDINPKLWKEFEEWANSFREGAKQLGYEEVVWSDTDEIVVKSYLFNHAGYAATSDAMSGVQLPTKLSEAIENIIDNTKSGRKYSQELASTNKKQKPSKPTEWQKKREERQIELYKEYNKAEPIQGVLPFIHDKIKAGEIPPQISIAALSKGFEGIEGIKSKQFYQDLTKRSDVKKIEKEIIQYTLDNDFKEQKKIDANELKAAIIKNIMPLTKLYSKKWADYGQENIPAFGERVSAVSVIYNSPALHREPGHWADMMTQNKGLSYDIEYIPERKLYVAVATNKPSEITDPRELLPYLGHASKNEEDVQRWIDETKSSKPIKEWGLFGHHRQWDTIGEYGKTTEKKSDLFKGEYYARGQEIIPGDSIRYIAEIQSDTFQKEDIAELLTGGASYGSVLEKIKKSADKTEFTPNEYDAVKNFIKGYDDYYDQLVRRHESEQSRLERFDAIHKKLYDIVASYKKAREDGGRAADELWDIKNKSVSDPDHVEKHNALTEATREQERLVEDWVETLNDLYVPHSNNLYYGHGRGLNKYTLYEEGYIIEDAENLRSDLDSFRQGIVNEVGLRSMDVASAPRRLETAKGALAYLEDKMPKYELLKKQYLAYNQDWYKRIIKEIIRSAALEGKKLVRFPTPYVIARIEGFLSDEDQDYPFDVGRNTHLEVGDEVVVYGERMIVVDSGYHEFECTYANNVATWYADDVIKDQQEVRWQDFKDELERGDGNAEVEDWDAITGEEINKLFEEYGARQTDYNAPDDIFEKLADVYDGKVLKEKNLDAARKEYGTDEITEMGKDITVSIDDVQDYFDDWVADEIDVRDYLEGLGKVWKKNQDEYLVFEGNPRTMQAFTYRQPDSYDDEVGISPENVGEEGDFDYDLLNEDSRSVLSQYVNKYIPYFRELRKDATIVNDDRGYRWWETEITEDDATTPIIAYSLKGNQQIHQTQTPEFKKWFGNSKVVDKDGKPLVVYHGTNKEITKFSGKKIGRSSFDPTNPNIRYSIKGAKPEHPMGEEKSTTKGFNIKTMHPILKDVLPDMIEQARKEFDEMRGKRMTTEQAINAGTKYAATLKDEDILNLKRGDVRNATQTLGMRIYAADNLLKNLDRLKAMHEGIEPLEVLSVKDDVGKAMQMYMKVRALGTEAGRTISFMSIQENDALIDAMKSMRAIFDSLDLPTDSLGKMLDDVEKKPGFKDKAVKWFYEFILSNPFTDMANIFGNMGHLGTEITSRFMFGELNKKKLVSGLAEGIKRGNEEARKILAGDVRIQSKFMEGADPSAYNLKGTSPLLNIARATLPTTRLAIEDAYFRNIAQGIEKAVIQGRLAKRYGVPLDEIQERMKKITEDPDYDDPNSETFQQAIEDIERYGRFITFQEKLGKKMSGLQTFSESPPVKVIIPFVRTPYRIIKASLVDWSPIGFMQTFTKEYKKAGEFHKRNVLRRAIVGTMFYSALMWLMGEDKIQITGSLGSDTDKRDELMRLGYRPNFIYVKTPWGKTVGVSYQNLNPWNAMFGVLGNISDEMRWGKKYGGEEKTFSQRASRALAGTFETLTDQSFLKGVGNFFQYTQFGNENYIRDLGVGIATPNIISFPRQVKEYVTGNKPTYQAENVEEAIKRKAGMTEDLTPAYDVYGDQRQSGYERFWFVPSTLRNAKVEQLMIDKDLNVSYPKKTTKLGDRQMTQREFAAYVRLSGKIIYDQLQKNYNDLKKLDGESAQKIVDKIRDSARDNARKMLNEAFEKKREPLKYTEDKLKELKLLQIK